MQWVHWCGLQFVWVRCLSEQECVTVVYIQPEPDKRWEPRYQCHTTRRRSHQANHIRICGIKLNVLSHAAHRSIIGEFAKYGSSIG
jgi:hypothetical protein